MLDPFLKLSIIMLDLLVFSIAFFSVKSNHNTTRIKDQSFHLKLDPSPLLRQKPKGRLFLGVLRLVF